MNTLSPLVFARAPSFFSSLSYLSSHIPTAIYIREVALATLISAPPSLPDHRDGASNKVCRPSATEGGGERRRRAPARAARYLSLPLSMGFYSRTRTDHRCSSPSASLPLPILGHVNRLVEPQPLWCHMALWPIPLPLPVRRPAHAPMPARSAAQISVRYAALHGKKHEPLRATKSYALFG